MSESEWEGEQMKAITLVTTLLFGCADEKCCDAVNSCACFFADGGYGTLYVGQGTLMMDCDYARTTCVSTPELEGMALDGGCQSQPIRPSCSCAVGEVRCD